MFKAATTALFELTRAHSSTRQASVTAQRLWSSSAAVRSNESTASSSSTSSTTPIATSQHLSQVVSQLRGQQLDSQSPALRAATAASRSKSPSQQQQQPRSFNRVNRNRNNDKDDTYQRLQQQFAGTNSSRSRFSRQTTNIATTPEQKWANTNMPSLSDNVTTTSARSFNVTFNDVGRAVRNLNRVLRENNVRAELRQQERFESKSDKRVRLNSERHRRRFKIAVGKAVQMAMRNKDK
ncbi:hypothetical protein OIO90_000525 [Microbotryomycetes sp. JL221]|nr:hypothetical protein OIO90_000525 [Microbotryomycetes sp. JL221]